MTNDIVVTPAKTEANRLNAQKSTGLRTCTGKAKSRMNALKHGVLANSAVIHAYRFEESAKNFKALCQEFYRTLVPVGSMEEALVDRIIMVIWRQRRLHIAETGEIAKAINDAESPEGPDYTDTLFLLSQNDPALPAVPDTVPSCRRACESLKTLQHSIERNCLLAPEEVTKFYHAAGRSNSHLIHDLIELQSKFAEDPENAKLGSVEAIQEHLKQELLKCLLGKLRDAQSRLNEQLERRSTSQRVDKSAAMLPSSKALDKILRYENNLERQSYRALNQLERLQRARQGETIPPPISIIT